MTIMKITKIKIFYCRFPKDYLTLMDIKLEGCLLRKNFKFSVHEKQTLFSDDKTYKMLPKVELMKIGNEKKTQIVPELITKTTSKQSINSRQSVSINTQVLQPVIIKDCQIQDTVGSVLSTQTETM